MTRNRWIGAAAALVIASGALVGYAVAEEDPAEPAKPAAPAGQMPAWMQLTQEHKDLAKIAGTFDCTYVFTKPFPMKGKGVAKGKMIMNGRFFEQTFESSYMGQPWNSRLVIGFDTIAKEHVSTWIDSGSPYLYVSRGTEKDGAVHYRGKAPEPMTGQIQDTYGVMKWVDDDTYTYEMGEVLEDGSLVKHGTMTYKRRKE